MSEPMFDPQVILDAMVKLNDAGATETKVLTVKGLRDAINPIKIGELFGMEVYADPLCPPDKWYIQQAPKSNVGENNK